jgi:hypothetical protein
MNSTTTENTSGQGPTAVVPREIQGWNWGAFLLTWIWGIGNNVLLALLTLVPLVGLVMWFVLGVKGTEWAWQNKRWDSIEHFQRVQRTWTKWGVIVLLVSCVLAAILMALLFFVITTAMKNTEPYRAGVDHLHADTAAMAELGAPVTTGIPSGSESTSDGDGEASLQIPVHGASKSGTIYVEAIRSDGQWHFQRIDLVVDDQRIDLNAEGKAKPADGK